MKPIQIAIDGPAGAGKSTIAKKLSKLLNYTYIDTGAMYRAITFVAIQEMVNTEKVADVVKMAEALEIEFTDGSIYVNGKNLNQEVRGAEVTKRVSVIAQIPEIREILVRLQRKIAENNNIVMDGRDVGSYVLPDATLKIYLTASVEERAARRHQELADKGIDIEEVKKDIILRDHMDTKRSHSPLIKAWDAIEIDTTSTSIDEVINKIICLLKDKLST